MPETELDCRSKTIKLSRDVSVAESSGLVSDLAGKAETGVTATEEGPVYARLTILIGIKAS